MIESLLEDSAKRHAANTVAFEAAIEVGTTRVEKPTPLRDRLQKGAFDFVLSVNGKMYDEEQLRDPHPHPKVKKRSRPRSTVLRSRQRWKSLRSYRSADNDPGRPKMANTQHCCLR